MTEYSYNKRYLIRDGEPWFPVMGEMHYSRYKKSLWEESLRKMKAGGVSVVSTYVIWIHHEEQEGVFEFKGCRDLGAFVRLCKKIGIDVFLRIGPWVHGEVRNGGFPDWLQHREKITLRSDDPEYLDCVRRYWQQVFFQVKGLMHEDGGPIIGVQIENEYGHVGGLRGEAGEQHIRTLTALAKNIGFHAPFYTATGWGGACVGDLLPVMGGYCDAPWAQTTKELRANANYLFKNNTNDTQIASDHREGREVTFNEEDFPFLTAELGGGLQVTKHRRPIATGADIGAMSLTKLGSGVAMLGYYMYHGGSNPEGKLSTLQESRATGYLNDLPEINYDFNAPIRQYGTISDSYKEIRMLSMFLQDFGSDLVRLEVEIAPFVSDPEDLETLRLARRYDERHGYIFFNNYQRRRTMARHESVVLNAGCGAERVEFPPVSIESGQYGFFPYNMKLGNAVLKSALAVPLCRLQTEKGNVFVFYGDWEPHFSWKDDIEADILHLSRKEALQASRIHLDQDYLILSDNYVWEENNVLRVTGGSDTMIRCFPEMKKGAEGFICLGREGSFWIYERKIAEKPAATACQLIEEDAEKRIYKLKITYGERSTEKTGGRDTLLILDYSGESMEVWCDGRKINDYFYTGQKEILSLGYFGFPSELDVVVHALRDEEDIYLEKWPEMDAGSVCSLNSVVIQEEYR